MEDLSIFRESKASGVNLPLCCVVLIFLDFFIKEGCNCKIVFFFPIFFFRYVYFYSIFMMSQPPFSTKFMKISCCSFLLF